MVKSLYLLFGQKNLYEMLEGLAIALHDKDIKFLKVKIVKL